MSGATRPNAIEANLDGREEQVQVGQRSVQMLSLMQNAKQNPFLIGIKAKELLANGGQGRFGGALPD